VIRRLALLFTLLSLTGCWSQTEIFYRGGTSPVASPHVGTRLLLVGDAGHSTPESPVLLALRARASVTPERTLVAFLGDNIYPAGLPSPESTSYAAAASHLSAQIDAVRTSGARAVFVPGNHDWDNSGPDGLQALRRQTAFVDHHSAGAMRLIPTNGEPGPVCESFGDLYLVFLDTQWWLHTHERSHGANADYEQAILSRLRRCLTAGAGRKVVVLAHHPLQTEGPHGGFANWRDYLFPLTRWAEWFYLPLPVLGSAYVLARQLGVTNQDLAGAKNAHMVAQLEGILRQAPPLIFAAGHEHTLQVANGNRGSRFHVVSGSGSELSDVGEGPDTLFAQSSPGFIELEFTEAGRVIATVHSQNGEENVHPVWRYVLQ
jgi:hypothetical protein